VGAVAASLVAVTVVGCSEGSEVSGTYKAADAERLANVAPRTPGWPPWPQKPEPERSSTESADEVAARDPIFAEFRRRTAGMEQDGSGNRWVDDDKLANLVVGFYDTPTDAHEGFVASNDLSRA
jgi:hypothetical protein